MVHKALRDESAEQLVLNLMGEFGKPHKLIAVKGREFNINLFKRQRDEGTKNGENKPQKGREYFGIY